MPSPPPKHPTPSPTLPLCVINQCAGVLPFLPKLKPIEELCLISAISNAYSNGLIEGRRAGYAKGYEQARIDVGAD